jgi:hypothetical protein
MRAARFVAIPFISDDDLGSAFGETACCLSGLQSMEPLWSPVVANDGNRGQIKQSRKPQKQAKTVATGCHALPEKFHGKEGVDGSSPSEGLKYLQFSYFCCLL